MISVISDMLNGRRYRRLAEDLEAQLEELQAILKKKDITISIASGAQAVSARRIQSFHNDHPALWKAYFTKAGELARIAKEHEPC